MLRMVQINNLYDSASRRRKLIIRFSVLCLVALFISQVIPTLADEQSRSTELQGEIAPSDTSTATSEPDSTNPDTPTSTTSPTSSPSPSPTPTYTPAVMTPGQGMDIGIPTSVSVDPRAQVVTIPRLRVSGPTYLLACFSGSNVVIDLLSKGYPDDRPASNLYLTGDLTSNVTISGPTDFVISALNSVGGLRVSGLGRKLQGTTLEVSLVSVDKMAESGYLCAKAQSANIRSIKFSPLGVGLEIKKGEVNLD